MAKQTLREFIEEKVSSGVVSADDVIQLRRYIYADMAVSLEEGAALFKLNNADCDYDKSWFHLFPEAIADILVNQAEPKGYISQENAEWLISQIVSDGDICTKTELDAVLHVMEKTADCPELLENFALNAVRVSVMTGEGCTRSGSNLKPGVIYDGEVELLRRVLYAFASQGGSAISKTEAEILFDINDATIEAENSPAWTDLFVKAIAGYVMALSGYEMPSREIALQRSSWLSDKKTNNLRAFSEVQNLDKNAWDEGLQETYEILQQAWTQFKHSGKVLSGVATVADCPESLRERKMRVRLEKNVHEHEKITADEAAWLTERIGRDGILHENERALLRFVKDKSPVIHPALKPLIDDAA